MASYVVPSFLLAGTRNAVLNTEARTVEADVLSRRCVMMRLMDFSYEQYQKALRQSAGAVVIILPQNMLSVPQDVIRVSFGVSDTLVEQSCSPFSILQAGQSEMLQSLSSLGTGLSGFSICWANEMPGRVA